MAHWRTFLESEVIRFVDLEQDYTVTIKKVEKGDVTGAGGKKSQKAMLWFDQTKKPLAAGTAILSTIADLYGSEVKGWVGKSITIYPDPTVQFGGKKVGGVRVRPNVPEMKKGGAS